MIAPASSGLGADLGITSDSILAMCTSVFVLAYAVGPLFLGPMSEIFGRSRVIQCSNVWYFAWNLACGFATSEGQYIAFRFLAGLGGSAPLSIGGGVLGDIWRTEERGMALGIYALAPLLGPVVGPIAGAWIAEKSTWRWVFWSTSILAAVVQVPGFFLMQETYAPVLLERKAKLIRESMQLDTEKGAISRPVRTVFESNDRQWQHIFMRAITRPIILFFHEPVIQLLGIYMGFIYGLLYVFLTTIPSIFEGVYGQRPGFAGIHYLALGLGLAASSQINAHFLDRIYIFLKERNNGIGRPEFRLPLMVPGTICLPIGLLICGWAVEAHVHWIVPDIGIVFIGVSNMLNVQCIQSYVIDAFTLHAASALAAVTFLRSLAGFGFPLFAPVMYANLGFGKGDTVLAVVAIVIGCPAPWLFWKYGERIRKRSAYAR
ncbi:hypothetical protein PLICRDRAFT_112075 [Plicaturopsis crispa FD-325 SS-3]|nr:hypothetical protein PLICRDRAFT_112075 [Plicaturopsis crispa FD-325 SS-3]